MKANDIKYRKAMTDELDALNAISVRSKQYWNYPAEWIARWMSELTLSEKQFSEQKIIVAEADGVAVGFCALSETEYCYEIEHLWLLPAHIGKGCGKTLLSAALREFAKADKPILVESDPHAEGFYRRCGFTTVGAVESYPKGRFLPVMKRPIDREA